MRKCRRVVCDHAVTLNVSGGRAGYAGLTTCGSVWSCPRCSSTIWAKRADELDAAVRRWDELGGQVAMVTLTMRHDRDEQLVDLWDALSSAWAAATGNYRGARDAIEHAGGAGWARVVEATHGHRHGWHLHVHALVFIDAGADADELGRAMFSAWRSRLVKMGKAAPIEDQGGLDVRVMDLTDSASEVARYVAKATYESTRHVAAELSPAGKRARRGNRRPFDVLDDLGADDPSQVDAGIWAEWEQGSKGRRAIGWKKGTRELLGLGAELADEDLAEDLDEDAPELERIATICKPDWAELCRIPGAPAGLLDLAELAPEGAAQELVARRLEELLGRPAWDYANNCGGPDRNPAVERAPVLVEDAAERFDGTERGFHDVGGRLVDRVTGEILLTLPPSGVPRYVREWAEAAHRVDHAPVVVERANLFADLPS